ncbi:MAG: CheR family methyltransferase [Kineosporiaceae bacterium]
MSGTAWPASPASAAGLSPESYAWVRRFLLERTGIELKDGKQALVTTRLDRRVRHHGLAGYDEYVALLAARALPGEEQVAIDLLTTNETSFFREAGHFELLRTLARSHDAGRPLRVWSAASSTGEEAYTIALVLADELGEAPWEVVATDVSSRCVEATRRGLYAVDAAQRIPEDLRRRFCLRGREEHEGLFTVESRWRARVRAQQANLTADLPDLGRFDVAFLRNVMIYFSPATKQDVVARVAGLVRPGGHLVVGQAESLAGIPHALQSVAPSVYRIPG